jgi:hypothetical protein
LIEESWTAWFGGLRHEASRKVIGGDRGLVVDGVDAFEGCPETTLERG